MIERAEPPASGNDAQRDKRCVMSAMYVSRLVGVTSAMQYMPACRVVCRPGCLVLMCERRSARQGRRARHQPRARTSSRGLCHLISQPACPCALDARASSRVVCRRVLRASAAPQFHVYLYCASFPFLYFYRRRNNLYRSLLIRSHLSRVSRIRNAVGIGYLRAVEPNGMRSFSIC